MAEKVFIGIGLVRKTNIMPKLTTIQTPEQLLTRRRVADRFDVSTETIKRWTRAGKLNPLRFNSRNVRYKLSEILAIEQQAAGGAK